MAFTLPWSVNKLVSTHINDSNSVEGTYTDVSLKVDGYTELANTYVTGFCNVNGNITTTYSSIYGGLQNQGQVITGLGTAFTAITTPFVSQYQGGGSGSYNITLPDISYNTQYYPTIQIAKNNTASTFTITSLDPSAVFRTFRSEAIGVSSYVMALKNTFAILTYNAQNRTWVVNQDSQPINDITYTLATDTTEITGNLSITGNIIRGLQNQGQVISGLGTSFTAITAPFASQYQGGGTGSYNITLPDISYNTQYYPTIQIAKNSAVSTFTITSLDPSAVFRTFRSEATGASYVMSLKNTFAILTYSPTNRTWVVNQDSQPINNITYTSSTNTTTISSNLSITGNATFTTHPSSTDTQMPTSGFNLITKAYGDNIYAVKIGNNTFGGTNSFVGNTSLDAPITSGSVLIRYGNQIMLEVSQYALYSPLSISPAFNQITFNYAPVFRDNIILDMPTKKLYIGDAYGSSEIRVDWGNISINNDSLYGNTQFYTNTMEAFQAGGNCVHYSLLANGTTLYMGNSTSTNALQLNFNNTIFTRDMTINGNINTASENVITQSSLDLLATGEFAVKNANNTFTNTNTFNGPITVSGNITANSLTITPTQLSFLNAVSAGKIGQSEITNGYVDLSTQQSVAGIKDFTASYTGAKNFVPYPANYTRTSAYNQGIISLGSLALNSLVGSSNTNVIAIGDSCLSGKSINTQNTVCIGVSNLYGFTSASFQDVCCFGGGNFGGGNFGNFPMTNVSIVGSNTSFWSDAFLVPTSITNASFFHSVGIDLTASGAVSDVYGISTDQYITASNQGKIGKPTIPLTIYGNTTINNNLKINGNILTNASNVINQARLDNLASLSGNILATSVYATIGATSVNWDTTPPASYPRYILFSAAGSATTTLTLPQISNSSVYEGMEFYFRRTNQTAGSTTTSILSVSRAGTDLIYGINSMATSATVTVLASGTGANAMYARIVCVSKSGGRWAYFPS